MAGHSTGHAVAWKVPMTMAGREFAGVARGQVGLCTVFVVLLITQAESKAGTPAAGEALAVADAGLGARVTGMTE
jgi:hypothetical protein